jgi:hypothetical protein
MFRNRTQMLLGAQLALVGLITFASNPAHSQLTLPYAQATANSLPAFAISNQGGDGIAGQSDVGLGMHGISGYVGIKGDSTSTAGGSGVLGNGNYIGVYGKGPYGVVGTNNGFPNGYAGYFAGTVLATNFATTSDARFKTHIATLPNALDRVLAMRGVSFDWRRNEFPDKNFKPGQQFGFIAQEMEKVCPALVNKDRDGYRAVDYTQVVPMLVEAMKQQQQQIDALQKQVASVKMQQTHIAARNVMRGNTNPLLGLGVIPLVAVTLLAGFGTGRLRKR